MKGYIRNILNSSAVDGPGNRMVLFFQGCNFNCTYCHNPETIAFCQDNHDADVYAMTVEEVVEKIEKGLPFISGVTLSGGECTMQFEFLLSLAKTLDEQGVSVYVDTNGTLSLEKMKMLARYVDRFMLDVKAVDPSIHKQITGQDNRRVLANLKYLAEEHKLYEVRTVVVPDVVDNESTVAYVSSVLAKYNKATRYKLIQYRAHGVRSPYSETYESPEMEYMQMLKEKAAAHGLTDVIIV